MVKIKLHCTQKNKVFFFQNIVIHSKKPRLILEFHTKIFVKSFSPANVKFDSRTSRGLSQTEKRLLISEQFIFSPTIYSQIGIYGY